MPGLSLTCALIAASLTVRCAQGRPVSPTPATSQEPPHATAPRLHQGTRPWADSSAHTPEAEIYRTWLKCLASKAPYWSMGSWKPSPYWLAAEQQQWPVYDLASFYLPDSARPEVLSIERDPDLNGEYRVVTRFESDDENNSLRSRTPTMTVFALRTGKGWVFANALPRLTRAWRREVVGQITYVMQPGYPFNRGRAEHAAAFVDSLATALDVPPLERVTYYLTTSEDEAFRIIGLETDKKFGPVGGFAQPRNHLLFSAIPALGENYRHELTHMVVLPLWTPRTSYLVSEGVPTWLGGTSGIDFPTAARGLATFLAQHPEVSLDSMLITRFPVAQFYPGAGVFVMMAFEHGGTASVKALFDAGSTPADFRAGAERLFGQPWASIAANWRNRVLSFISTSSGPS